MCLFADDSAKACLIKRLPLISTFRNLIEHEKRVKSLSLTCHQSFIYKSASHYWNLITFLRRGICDMREKKKKPRSVNSRHLAALLTAYRQLRQFFCNDCSRKSANRIVRLQDKTHVKWKHWRSRHEASVWWKQSIGCRVIYCLLIKRW